MERKRLLEEVRGRARFKHYSLRTEEAYTAWLKRFVIFHGMRHPRALAPRSRGLNFLIFAASMGSTVQALNPTVH